MTHDTTWSRRRTVLLLGLLCLLVYNANLRCIGAGDTLPARYQPFGLWRHGTLALAPIGRLVAHGHPSLATWSRPPDPGNPGTLLEPWAYWMVRGRHDDIASLYPVVAPVLVAPLYLPATLYLRGQGWQPWQVDWVAEAMEKVSASLLAAITVLVVDRLLRRHAGGWSLALVLAFAFGTNTWMIASQALWQHGAGELLVALALLLVTSRPTPARWAALGAVAVAMAACRPPDALLAAAFLLYAAWVARRDVPRPVACLIAGALVPLALVAAYNLGVPGSLFGGYGTVDHPGFFSQSIGTGLAGLLVSPTRGLLVFAPFLAFVPLGLARRLRDPRPERVLAGLLAAAAVAQLVVYARADWRQGHSWGPRWLTDVLPILMWMLAPAPLLLRPAARVLLAAAIGASVAVQAIGAFWYTGDSDKALYESADWMPAAWRPANAPFVAALRDARPRGDLACPYRGHVDDVGGAPAAAKPDAPAPVMATGTTLAGWALACGRTPADVLLLVDGRVVGQAVEFSASRPDVVAATGSAAPSAWSVRAKTLGLAPGERVLQVAVRADARGELRIVSESRVELAPDPATPQGLAALARIAAARLRAHQGAAGAWLTAFTTGSRYDGPVPEMNTFLTAMLVDIVEPVAKRHGLEDVLAKARAHLTGQIEADGLVRYHGLPEGPGMGVLGCAITPDADDTALAWRIAPPPAGDARRASMLRTLASYQDARGLYRTWLAPQERYLCLDPGRDPNPADLTIQMHVLMMLAGTEPSAARSLCRALAEHVGDESLWVYYSRTPLVPWLRSADLRAAGCDVDLPDERLVAVAGQERWRDVVRRLVEARAPAGPPLDAPASLALLGELAGEDFAMARGTPPLLYHNDLTATVSRYYWSEDIGYALWLRLYEEVRAAEARGAEAAPERPRTGP